MEKIIKFTESSDLEEIPYTDSALIEEIEKRVERTSANTIEMHFCEMEGNRGCIIVNIMDVNNDYVYPVLNASASIHLHNINLDAEGWKDNMDEFQREKKLIKKAFPNVKVSSNFR